MLLTRKLEEEKENFWNELFHSVSFVPQNEIVALAGDMNGHVGSINVGYDGMHDGFGYGARNADRTWRQRLLKKTVMHVD